MAWLTASSEISHLLALGEAVWSEGGDKPSPVTETGGNRLQAKLLRRSLLAPVAVRMQQVVHIVLVTGPIPEEGGYSFLDALG